MFEKLLVPIEFGEAQGHVARLARKLAKPGATARPGATAKPVATVRLVHVLTNETTMFFADLLDLDRFTSRAREGLDAVAALLKGGDLTVETKIREGAISKELLDEAKDFGADVIVAGSHGRRGLQRLLLGSVAERLLRGSELPVCIVKGAVDETPNLGRIALATDLEVASVEATRCFTKLLESTKAAGVVVHAFHAEHWLSMTSVPAPYVEGVYASPLASSIELEEHIRKRRDERQAQLQGLADSLTSRGLSAEARLVDGEPWTSIAELVKSERIDLLVLGTHHYSRFDRAILGSIAEKTLRSVACPVLVVPHQTEHT